jgi:uncharacterized protein (TIGR03067 family)
MKLLLTAMIIAIATGTFNSGHTSVLTGELNGDWVPVKQILGGKELPGSAFENQLLTLSDSNYTLVAESVDKGTAIYADGRMDIFGKEGVNKGRSLKAIYKLENEVLTICYDLTGTDYPESFETEGNPMIFLSEFKRKQ